MDSDNSPMIYVHTTTGGNDTDRSSTLILPIKYCTVIAALPGFSIQHVCLSLYVYACLVHITYTLLLHCNTYPLESSVILSCLNLCIHVRNHNIRVYKSRLAMSVIEPCKSIVRQIIRVSLVPQYTHTNSFIYTRLYFKSYTGLSITCMALPR